MSVLTRIHQIEVTTRCNLRCVYCPHPTMERDKVDMDMPTFKAALNWVKHFKRVGPHQTELSLTGIGDGPLHPMFAEMVSMARMALGEDGMLLFATNGIALTGELLDRIAPYRPVAFISLHRPEKAGPALERCKERGIATVTNAQFVTSALDWAGQVDWFTSHPPTECQYLAQGWGTVLVDGRITRCCMDSTGGGTYGSVWDSPEALSVTPYELCDTCSLTVPKEMRKPEEARA